MTISLRLIDSQAAIEQKINRAIAEEMNKKIMRGRAKLISDFRSLIGIWLRSQPELLSLNSGGADSLAAQFGLPQGSAGAVVSHIVTSVQSTIDITLSKFKPNLTGGLFLSVQPDHLSNLLGLQAGHVTTSKGTDLHWLSWLLERGRDTIIVGYHYTPDVGTDGRSGAGTMSPGQAWRVPPQYAGTIADNFITRAFEGKEKDVAHLFNRLLRF